MEQACKVLYKLSENSSRTGHLYYLGLTMQAHPSSMEMSHEKLEKMSKEVVR